MFAQGIIEPSLESAYSAEDKDLRLRRFRVACFLGFFGTLSGAPLDYSVYPEVFGQLLSVRGVAALLIAVLFCFNKSNFGRKHIESLNILWALVMVTSICAMVFLTGGTSSPYYAGLNLVLLGAGVLLPWTFREMFLVCISTLVMYVAACVFRGSFSDADVLGTVLINNSFFVLLTGLISTTSSYYNTEARIRDFKLRKELDTRNQELEDMDRLKSDFFSNVSHELRTPLTLILSPIQDLLRQPQLLSDRVAGMLMTARDNSLRLLKLVNDLLEVIRLEEGKEQLARESVDLNSLVNGLFESMQHLADQRGIEFKKELTTGSSVIEGDMYAFERIFLNLLSNAIKFTPDGGRVSLKTSRNDYSLTVSIEDTGIGIDKRDIPHIFERFRQADSSSTRKFRGSGLGLALVKDLTEKLGGSISADSVLGEGTSMAVTFPFGGAGEEQAVVESTSSGDDIIQNMHQLAEHRAALPLDSPFKDLEELPASGSGPRLMIVDDEPDMRQYLAGILESDYRVSLARDGKHALKMAIEQKPELMLLDLMLPEMDGHEVCKRLKASPGTRSIKIVLLTARIDESAKITALENGADDFLTKPFSRTEVETRLRNLLETSKLESELRNRNAELQSTLDKLKQTQASLVQSEKLNSLGSLAAGLLHEVNNPLNYVIAALQMLALEPEIENSEDMKEYLGDIDEGVQRIRNIVTDLHTFAHPSELDKQKKFLISSVVESSMRFTSHHCDGISVNLALDGQDQIVGSQGHMIQILVNLISNAAKAIKARGDGFEGEIVVGSVNEGDRVYLTVKDNGVGMDESVLTRIFDPFYTTRDVGEGMGLGLSICHTIMESHKGEIRVESELGVGTVFTLDLPIDFVENEEGNSFERN